MSHAIDMSNQRANMAYVGEEPWHGLGEKLQPGMSRERWLQAAGLEWQAHKAPVQYTANAGEGPRLFAGQSVLYRSDTHAPLAVVSATRYKPVQPAEVIDFFAGIAKVGGFELETAGVLNGGRRVWALAKVGPEANVVGKDRVKAYALLATGYDTQMATIAKFVATRVVCQNTLGLALREAAAKGHGKGGEQPAIVRVGHSREFDAKAVRDQLGIVTGAWAQFLTDASVLAEKGVSDKQAQDFAFELFRDSVTVPKALVGTNVDMDALVRNSRGYQRVLSLFNGEAKGSALTGGKTGWQLLNAVTQYVDWERGRSRDSGVNAAWFGDGDRMKSDAKNTLLELAS